MNRAAVSFGESKHMSAIAQINWMRFLNNIEMFMPKPSWMIDVSALILLKIAPVLFSSKKPTSLLIVK